MYMYNILAVTNRKLCKNDLLEQIKKIIEFNLSKDSINNLLPNNSNIKIILREKDLCEEEYEFLARKVLNICNSFNIQCILHTYYNVARKLNCRSIHLPLHILKNNPYLCKDFSIIGVSIHSVDEAIEAQNLNASYITAGHIFNTDCKKGLPGRGLNFLKEVVKSVDIPVYAIGGINNDNIDSVIKAGAYGVCMMSGFMEF